ncbi:hypothetical protein MKW94_027953, partial [Papaver nudicaule]|nr:hypothetical protein [Papaver nudicaule]
MPSLLSVIQLLRVFLFVLLVVCYAQEAEVQAQRRRTPRPPARTHSNSGKIAKKGCNDRCGDVSIPFPFGMGASECYYNPYYEIKCNYSASPPVPWLEALVIGNETHVFLKQKMKKFDVLEITEENIRVNMVASVSCDLNSTTNGTFGTEYITYFPVSYSLNKLTVIGCDIYGSVRVMNSPFNQVHKKMPKKESFLSSSVCMSLCVGSNISTPSRCAGYACCSTSIPEGTYIYSVSTTRVSQSTLGSSFPCNHAFVADQNFSGVDELLWSREDALVPVVLDWAMHDYDTCEEAAQKNYSMNDACGRNTACVDSHNGPGYRCKCSKGYDGNPYLLHGCQDVDECKESQICGSKEVICTNTEGNYNCSCSPGKIMRIGKVGYYCMSPLVQVQPTPLEARSKLGMAVFL